MKILNRYCQLFNLPQPLYKGWVFLWLFCFATPGISQIYISEGTQISLTGEVEIIGEVISQSETDVQVIYSDEETLVASVNKIESAESHRKQTITSQPSEQPAQKITDSETEEEVGVVYNSSEPDRGFTSLPAESSWISGGNSGMLAARTPPAKNDSTIESFHFRHYIAEDPVPGLLKDPKPINEDYKIGYTNRPPPIFV